MRRWLGWIAIVWLLLLCALALVAYGSPAGATSLDERTRAVAQQLRCPVCQGESVADSPSGIARAMRTIIRRQLAAGRSPDSIKTYMVSRYGNWILLAPPASGIGTIAWLAPPLLVLGGIGLLLALVAGWRARGLPRVELQFGDPLGMSEPGNRAAYIERVRAEVDAD